MSNKEFETKIKRKGEPRGTERQRRSRQHEKHERTKKRNSGINEKVARDLKAWILDAKRVNPDFDDQKFLQLVDDFDALKKYLPLLEGYGNWYQRTMDRMKGVLNKERLYDDPVIDRRANALVKAIDASPRSRNQVLGLLRSLLKAYVEKMEKVLEDIYTMNTAENI